jgi:trk system potassium uptake protein TrkH
LDYRPILYVVGALLCTLSISMTLPMLADMVADNPDWKVFFLCIAITAFFGGTLVLTNAGTAGTNFTIRQAFVLTASCWVVMAFFSALPIWLSHEKISFTDAFFEAMSGVTTTGATVLTGLENLPPGLLLWRSVMQFLGGIGFILMAILILPFLKVGGMQLFRTESSDKYDKPLPRLQRLGLYTGLVYLGLAVLCGVLYWVAGMAPFDALNHAMTTVATAGMSTHDASFAHYDVSAIHMIAIIFMILGGMPFVLYVRCLYGESYALFTNSQVHTFLGLIAVTVVAMTVWLMQTQPFPFIDALTHAAFNVVSVITTTGYASADYMQWGTFAVIFFFIIGFFGGCTGSTSGGIKIMRFQIMARIFNRHILKLQQPNIVYPLRYEGRTVPEDIPYSVMVFLFAFLVSLAVIAIALGLCGLDFTTALSGAATTLTNVGPGLGDIIGPAGNYAPLPDNAKWILSFGMLLGRLELFTILVLLSFKFWQR